MPGLFVTATGTDVGKTYVTCGLIRAARRAGRKVHALKPVLSGFSKAEMLASDAGLLLTALGDDVTESSVARMSPWRFAAPLSPDMAAAAEGEEIDFGTLLAACDTAAWPDALTFIEGVGGVMVPLDRRHTTLDLLAALDLPVLLVSATGLGAISHCLTAVTSLAGRGLTPAAIVLNETAGSTVPLAATQTTLSAFCDDIPLHVLARNPDDTAFDELYRSISSH